MDQSEVIDARLQQWSVPSDVRDALRRVVAVVGGEGVALVSEATDEVVSFAVRGQPIAVYLSPSRLYAALEPEDAERAHRADSALGLEKESQTTWSVHCRYGRLDSSRLNSMSALMVKALRRFAPPKQVADRKPRRPASRGAKAAPSRRSAGVTSQEERRRAADAAIPRCPVPGCNLPMVGGSCGFHD